MRRSLLPALVAVLGVALVLVSGAAAQPAARQSQPQPTRLELRNAMGRLWEDHITWTRLYIIAALDNAPDLPATTDRLLQNQTDIGNAIKPFYGDAAGDQLTGLLRQHILIAADVVSAAKAGDGASLDAQMARWQSNADDIADFLSSANPDSWPDSDLRGMMRHHLDLTTAEVVARLHHDWPADVAAYDQVHTHILMLADTLTDGIVAQFPDRVASNA